MNHSAEKELEGGKAVSYGAFFAVQLSIYATVFIVAFITFRIQKSIFSNSLAFTCFYILPKIVSNLRIIENVYFSGDSPDDTRRVDEILNRFRPRSSIRIALVMCLFDIATTTLIAALMYRYGSHIPIFRESSASVRLMSIVITPILASYLGCALLVDLSKMLIDRKNSEKGKGAKSEEKSGQET